MFFLGESSHGVAEFSLAKTRIIQFLHQEMGYNVLAFESGMGNVMNAQGKIDKQSAQQTMKDGIFGVWWSKETLPLFEYTKKTQSTEQPLMLAGFDIQQQGAFTDGGWLENNQLAKQFSEVENQLVDWTYSKDLKGYQKAKPSIIDVYKQVKSQIPLKEKELKAAYPSEPHITKLMERTLADRIRLAEEYVELSIQSNVDIEQNKYDSFFKTMEWRDQGMLENLLWLAEEIYPTEKFIVWAHNDHIRKAQSEVMGSPYALNLMGERLPDIYKKNIAMYLVYIWQVEKMQAMHVKLGLYYLQSKDLLRISFPQRRSHTHLLIYEIAKMKEGIHGCLSHVYPIVGELYKRALFLVINLMASF